uniref:RRM domain-containing protein n=1 Tax=Caenorhabditis tropicalis TaxID=1561998 RepID=A0A1I7U0Q3_9PELO
MLIRFSFSRKICIPLNISFQVFTNITGVHKEVKLKRSQDLISVHDADYGTQQAKKALMCLPAAKPPTPMLYSQQLPLKNLYSQFSAGLLEESAVLHSASEPPMEMRIDTSKHFHVFVGDLSKDVSNELLKSTFQKYGDVSEAKVIRDAQTQKSKGYGFVSFPNKQNAENAISGMNGKWIGKRAVRTNWAARKNSEENRDKLTFEQVFNSTKADNTSVYVGNISPQTTDADLRDSFSTYGDIAEVRVFKTQRYAFVRYEKKECATKAIMEMNGKEMAGNQVRCSWGRTQAVPNQALNPLPIDLSSLMMPTMIPTTIPLIQNPFLNYEPATTLLYSSFPQW